MILLLATPLPAIPLNQVVSGDCCWGLGVSRQLYKVFKIMYDFSCMWAPDHMSPLHLWSVLCLLIEHNMKKLSSV